MLILASVSLNLISGNSGILKRAQEARETTLKAEAEEEKELLLSEANMAWYIDECPGTFETYFDKWYKEEGKNVAENGNGSYTYTASNGEIVDFTIGLPTVEKSKCFVYGDVVPKDWAYGWIVSSDGSSLILHYTETERVYVTLPAGFALTGTLSGSATANYVTFYVGGTKIDEDQNGSKTWSYTNNTEGDVEVELSLWTNGELTFNVIDSDGREAVFAYSTVSVTLDSNFEGGEKKTVEVMKNSKPDSIEELTRDDYEFLGWANSKDTISLVQTSNLKNTKFDKDTTYYARWKPTKPITIYLDAQGGTGGNESITIEPGQTNFSGVVNPTREGYGFEGWAPVPGCSTGSGIKTYYDKGFLDEGTTLYACWYKM